MRWKMLDRIDVMESGLRASAVKAVTSSEDYFEHHMPMFPVVPGTMLVEIMAQLGGRLAMYTFEKKSGSPAWAAVHGIEIAEFHEFVLPGYMLDVVAELRELESRSAATDCEILVAGTTFATARISFTLAPFDHQSLEGRRGLAAMREEMRLLYREYDLE